MDLQRIFHGEHDLWPCICYKEIPILLSGFQELVARGANLHFAVSE